MADAELDNFVDTVATPAAMWEEIDAVVTRDELAAAIAAMFELTPPLDSDADEAWRRVLVTRFATVRPFLRAGADIATRARDVEDGLTDVITVGTMALANPDLVQRVRSRAPLNTPNPATFYDGGAAGYTDDPAHTA